MEDKKNRKRTEVVLIEELLSSKLNRFINTDNELSTIAIEILELYFAQKKIYGAVKK